MSFELALVDIIGSEDIQINFSAEVLLCLRQLTKKSRNVLLDWPEKHLFVWETRTYFVLKKLVCRNQVGHLFKRRFFGRYTPIREGRDGFVMDMQICRPLRVRLNKLPVCSVYEPYCNFNTTYYGAVDTRYLAPGSWEQNVFSTWKFQFWFNFKQMKAPRQFLEQLMFRESSVSGIKGQNVKYDDVKKFKKKFAQGWTALDLLNGLRQLEPSRQNLRLGLIGISREMIGSDAEDRVRYWSQDDKQRLSQGLQEYEEQAKAVRHYPNTPIIYSKRVRGERSEEHGPREGSPLLKRVKRA